MSESNKKYDVVVIGAGPGGYVAAIRAAQLGLKTALIEKRSTLGGTCLNVGCIPSKALLESSELYSVMTHKAAKHGINTPKVDIDIEMMMARKNKIVKELTGGVGMLMKKNKIDVIEGFGCLQSPTQVVVQPSGQTIETKNIVLATGSEAVELPFLPFDGDRIVSSTEALSFPSVPESLVVIGAGAVGLEMGSVWARLGTQVTVIERLSQIVAGSDAEISKTLKKSLEKQGLSFLLDCSVKGVTKNSSGAEVLYDDANGKSGRVVAERVLVSVGRRAYTEKLGLDGVGVMCDRGKIVVDSHFQTNKPSIYAIGDVIRGPMLAHKAEEEGVAVAEIIAGQAGHVGYDAIPNIVYTWPELASVGITEEQAKEQGIAYKIGKFKFAANARAKTMDENEGMTKIIADAKTDRILGAHIVGPRASDMIAELAVAMEFQASAEDIARSCHAHPTLAEIVKEAALAVDGRALHS